MLRSVFHHLRDATPSRLLTREPILDSLKLACSAGLLASPWVFAFNATATWTLWVCGYAMLTVSLAALVAEADWEPRANLWLGAWVMAAPWALGFFADTEATFVHMAGGGLISVLSAVELWNAERNPPWRFRPGAASRAGLAPAMTEPSQAPVYHGLHDRTFARRRGSWPRQRFPHLRGTTANIRLRGRRREIRPSRAGPHSKLALRDASSMRSGQGSAPASAPALKSDVKKILRYALLG
jgi:hypothetical protein